MFMGKKSSPEMIVEKIYELIKHLITINTILSKIE